jgi:hypothetical protein
MTSTSPTAVGFFTDLALALAQGIIVTAAIAIAHFLLGRLARARHQEVLGSLERVATAAAGGSTAGWAAADGAAAPRPSRSFDSSSPLMFASRRHLDAVRASTLYSVSEAVIPAPPTLSAASRRQSA